MDSPTCIYCKAQGVPFDKDHVIPEALGTFENNWKLDCVCTACNGHFGRTIELTLFRDSTEALLRLRYGVKPASEADDLLYRRLTVTLGQPGFWYGAQFVFVPNADGTNIEPEPLPQVAFRRTTDAEWTWFTESQLADPNVVEPYKNALPGELEIRILGPSDTDRDRVIEKLVASGIKYKRRGDLVQQIGTDGQITTKVESVLDSMIFRAVAKIGFNYAAYVHGAAFVLRPDFDEIREYIRYGREPNWAPAVAPTSDSILFGDSRRWRQTNGHVVTLDWNYSGHGILAQVGLFNTMTYRVLLCPYYSGLWDGSLRSGHHFDIESREISPLASASFGIVPVIR
jgi:hypothetical protein